MQTIVDEIMAALRTAQECADDYASGSVVRSHLDRVAAKIDIAYGMLSELHDLSDNEVDAWVLEIGYAEGEAVSINGG